MSKSKKYSHLTTSFEVTPQATEVYIENYNDSRRVFFDAVNVERIETSLKSTIHEMPLGLTRDERRLFILAVAKSFE